MRQPLFFATLCLALLGCGADGLFFAEIEAEELCEQKLNQSFDPTNGAGAQLGSQAQNVNPELLKVKGTINKSFDLSLGRQLPVQEGLTSEMRLLRVVLTPSDYETALDAVDEALVQISAPAGSNLPPVTIVRYARGDAPPGPELRMEGDAVDLIPYLQDGRLLLNATITGVLPTTPWHGDVESCVAVKARLNYLQAMQQKH